MWVDRSSAEERVVEITDRVGIEDLTDLEMLALIAVLEPAEQRVNGHTATVLRLAPKQSRRRPKRTGSRSS